MKSRIKIKTSWTGLHAATELPFLARVAVTGKIVAIPEILRVYRVHPGSVYALEISKPKLVRHRIHKWLIRLDQLYVAVIYSMPFFVKLNLFSKIIMFTTNRYLCAIRKRLR